MFHLNNPIPRGLENESKKAANVLASFVKPNQVLGQDSVIPPSILKEARGLAIITVLKAGFLFSGRAGSGVIVARLPNGEWSAPSAIGMAGAGAGGLVGAELTDFVFILNNDEAVRSFSEFGTITLGGNISVSAGPLGRNAEAGASASVGGIAAVFSYSKSKGLFAGVSVEGSMIVERRETNRKAYGDNCTTKMILAGMVQPPRGSNALYRILESRAFNYTGDYDRDDFYDDIPNDLNGELPPKSNRYRGDSYIDDDNYYDHRGHRDRLSPRRGVASPPASSRKYATDEINDDETYEHRGGRAERRTKETATNTDDEELYEHRGQHSDHLPQLSDKNQSGMKAVALYNFGGKEEGDLIFKRGDIIAIVKRSDSQYDWWTGNLNGKEGLFPANYVEII
ncbi:hypothetical protein KAFR_0A00970 [Kazachstania africana CBS 2517]|uniref:SH3 domain-containing protein n=1 Tax=Kazachstania africana (strain ATCC 22294 / BCRC 22015 / CBS 2517 / CECT 1963 / NBRC 1671 / NRRL Y-8276) TaxID=1071382 RepID=H2AMD5_KAZAF|nr:hypothetical protein KAFR_0A00970 [Kazachstania africana CBS 2517]CCF55535.1 hypothetical protein KAFR_0A00970 [Kazachstania africana CBS 2517]